MVGDWGLKVLVKAGAGMLEMKARNRNELDQMAVLKRKKRMRTYDMIENRSGLKNRRDSIRSENRRNIFGRRKC
ncbi:hypothetical protein E2C01_055918 [Portunus trituberculatus]|uniref:Uncharacterized protein n=1 Tax=Portunus trituberculatus TaxID=210409 RepID=A0A5B7GP09_PORTR|nr:hypothetical protein [Portunus trituberculatus]